MEAINKVQSTDSTEIITIKTDCEIFLSDEWVRTDMYRYTYVDHDDANAWPSNNNRFGRSADAEHLLNYYIDVQTGRSAHCHLARESYTDEMPISHSFTFYLYSAVRPFARSGKQPTTIINIYLSTHSFFRFEFM